MSGEYLFAGKIVSPLKCSEKPWDLWVAEIGHPSPRRDEEPPAEPKGGASARRVHEAHPYKAAERLARARRPGLHRLSHETMSLHGLFPQMDNLAAAVCHMCGVIVKCSAAYRHLLESHSGSEPLPPPPPPVGRSRSRHKKDPAPPIPVDIIPVKLETHTSPIHNATAPLSRIIVPQPELQYLEEPGTSTAVTGEVQVCVESGELPVVSIQDTEDLPLGDNLTDDIFEIMNSEGIQSADDITNATDWKNIIRDIGNMQEINFNPTAEPAADPYPPLPALGLTEADLSGLVLAPEPPPARAPPAPAAKPPPRKSKFNLREYDPNKHCGVVTADGNKPCTRSLTCKAHALSLRRTVEGRSKPFDTLLAEHRAARDAAAAPPVVPLAPAPVPRADRFPSPLGVEDVELAPAATPPTVQAARVEPGAASPRADEAPPPPAPSEVWWYASGPRPLAVCTYNAAHAGGAVTLGKRFATVRSNIKSSLTRSQCKATGGYYLAQGLLAKARAEPEVRRLVASAAGRAADGRMADGRTADGRLVDERPLNGHRRPRLGKRAALDLGFALDPLLAADKC